MTKEEIVELIEDKIEYGIDKYLDARINFDSVPREYWDGYTDALEDVMKEIFGEHL